MRGVDRISSPVFRRNPEQAQASAKVNLALVLANPEAVLAVRNGERLLEQAKRIDADIKRGEPFREWWYDAIEKLYEKMWKGAGYGSINVHHDKPRATLRHPK
jgi:hypothetical protein